MAWHVVEAYCKDQAAAVLETLNELEIWASPFFLNHIAPRLMRRFAEAGSRSNFLCCARLLELAPDLAARAALMEVLKKHLREGQFQLFPTS